MKVAWIALLLPLWTAAQSPGALDSTFGQAGWTVVGDDDYDAPVAIHASAKRMVLAANSGHADTAGYDMDVLLLALQPDGSLDPGFGTGGKTRMDFPGQAFSEARDMAPLPDGGYAVLGYGLAAASPDRQQFWITCLDSLGHLVPTFGHGGHASLPFIGTYNIPEAILAQPDGKLLVVGSTYDSTLQHIEYPCIARLHPDGSLDSSFGGTGQLLLNYASGLSAAKVTHSNGGSFYDVALLPDGRILCAGSALGASGYNCALLLLHPDGRADSSFYGTGVLAWDNAPGCNNHVQSLAVLDTATILLQVKVDCWYLAADQYCQRLRIGDQPGDMVGLDGGDGERAGAMLQDGQGSLYLTGPAVALGQPSGWYSDRYSLCRVQAANGQLDQGFGMGGWFHAAPNPLEQSGAEAIALQPGGQVLVAGFLNTGVPGNLSDIGVVRLQAGLPLGGVNPTIEAFATIRAHPNPCHGAFTLTGLRGHVAYTLMGMDGRVWRQGDAQGDLRLEVEGLPAGCYVVRCRTREEMKAVRVVIE